MQLLSITVSTEPEKAFNLYAHLNDVINLKSNIYTFDVIINTFYYCLTT